MIRIVNFQLPACKVVGISIIWWHTVFTLYTKPITTQPQQMDNVALKVLSICCVVNLLCCGPATNPQHNGNSINLSMLLYFFIYAILHCI